MLQTRRKQDCHAEERPAPSENPFALSRGDGGSTAPGQKPTLSEAIQEAEEKSGLALPLSSKPVAFVFGPENGAVSEKLVYEAAKEAHAKNYSHLYVIGFAIQPNARMLIDKSASLCTAFPQPTCRQRPI